MREIKCTRRRFLKQSAGVSVVAMAAAQVDAAPPPLHVATNQYPWFTFYRRDKQDFGAATDEVIFGVAACGLNGYEPIGNSPEEVEQLAKKLLANRLEMRSLYTNSVLHEAEKVEANLTAILATADAAKKVGTKLIVTNPSPIKWGGEEEKTDAQLDVQVKALEKLGAELRRRDLSLAYHFHAPEMKNDAREFHRMLRETTPENVTLCLDVHWVYRGSGNSNEMVWKVIEEYHARVSELHLRQSQDGTWTETFGEGDIDYAKIARFFKGKDALPHLVLEQAVEGKTPKTMDVVKAHRIGTRYVRKIFGAG